MRDIRFLYSPVSRESVLHGCIHEHCYGGLHEAPAKSAPRIHPTSLFGPDLDNGASSSPIKSYAQSASIFPRSSFLLKRVDSIFFSSQGLDLQHRYRALVIMATNEPTSERLFKRRKVIKPRVRRDSESASERDEQGTAQQRQSVRTRRTGVGFSASTSQPPITEATEYETAVSAESAVSAVDSYAARFARPTGQTGSKNQDEDKHMFVSPVELNC